MQVGDRLLSVPFTSVISGTRPAQARIALLTRYYCALANNHLPCSGQQSMRTNKKSSAHVLSVYPNVQTQNFKNHFKAELWDPEEWTTLFNRSGARGIMFTTKHCDGYTHWKSPSKPGYNSVEAGPMRDVVGDLTAVCLHLKNSNLCLLD